MSIKDAALRFATVVENEHIQIRADQMEVAEALTNRINGVANDLKALDSKVTSLQEGQAQMLSILIDIQRRIS
ncbi:hypothetical protein SAMN05216276_1008157 [Streptosporangium subroseum]|uniref:Uncharacterized protein n=1 Tax=Streptosporangium subroseum TaxID=106412 RepID=A0A239DZW0_9ACTN|nr:hypothetical protein [Streptosporangium subroseum]SNS38000.1 hypothetical protein SAMN05216276_1008157 [Streptosporangium subroseum]